MVKVEQKERFLIIPYKTILDRNLIPIDKLIYGQIISLSNKKGYCYANNNFFMKENNISKSVIIRSLRRLEQNNYIQIIYNLNAKNQDRRTIYLKDEVVSKMTLP